MTAEIERFLADAQTTADLRSEIARLRGNLDALVGLATARGYRISRADADAFIAARQDELRDEQLDGVVGGKAGGNKGGTGSPPPDIDAIHQWLQDWLAAQPARPSGGTTRADLTGRS